MIKKILYILFISIIFVSFFISPKLFYNNINDVLRIWCLFVFPSIFTFCILSKIVLRLNILKLVSYIIHPFIKFDTNKSYEILLVSFLLGNPGTSQLIINELKNNNITKNDSIILLNYASFMNPIFIITIITSYNYSIRVALCIIIINTISNLVLLLFKQTKSIKYQEGINVYNDEINLDFFLTIINDITFLLIKIAGIMVFCNIIKYSFESIVLQFIDKNIFITLFFSLFEVSIGANDILNHITSLTLLIPSLCFLFSFQGLSINLQVLNVIKEDVKINIIKTRLIQAIISVIISLFII